MAKTAGLGSRVNRDQAIGCPDLKNAAFATEIVLSALPSSETGPYVVLRDRWSQITQRVNPPWSSAGGGDGSFTRPMRTRGNERTRVLSFMVVGVPVITPKLPLSIRLKLIKYGMKDGRHVLSYVPQVALDVGEPFLQIFVSLGGTGHVTTM